jgi:hypothetical protein
LERRAENRRAGPSVTYIVAKREGFKGGMRGYLEAIPVRRAG